MSHGEINYEIFIRVIKKILTERDDTVKINVRLITIEEAEEINRKNDKISVN